MTTTLTTPRTRTATKPEDLDHLLAHAFNDRDTAAVEALFEEDSITRSLPAQGSEAGPGADLVVGLTRAALGSEQRMNIEVVQVTQVGDIALLLSQWSVTGHAADGTPISINHRGVEVGHRQADGTWKYLIDVPGAADGAMERPTIAPLPAYAS